jgi:hypothetical protein
MNTKTLIAAAITAFGAIATLGASPAFASESIFEYATSYTTSTVSRAEVKAQAQQAREAGLITQGEHTAVVPVSGVMLSRVQVKAEAAEALRIGAISRHEQSVLPTQAQLDSIRMAGERAIAMTVAAR